MYPLPRPLAARRRPRVPVLPQMSETECGAACLAMIAGYFGRHTRIAELRDLIGIGRDGASALDLVRAAEGVGLGARALSMDLEPLRELRGPVMIHWRFNHYLVLERWDGRRAVVVDPRSGRRTIDAKTFSRDFTGVVLQFFPADGFVRRQRGRRTGTALFLRSLLAVSPSLLAKVVGASLILQVLVLVPALVTKVVVDVMLRPAGSDALTVVGAGALLLLVTDAVATYTRGMLLAHLHTAMDRSLMRAFFDHLLSLPYRYFQLRGSGDLLLRLSSHATIREIVSGQTLSLAIDGLFVLVYLALLGLAAPTFAVLAMAVGGVQCLLVALTFRAMREYAQRDVGAQAAAQSAAVEILSGAETIKAMGAEDHSFERWATLFDRQLAVSLCRRRLDSLLEAMLGVFRMGAPVLLLLVGAHEVVAGRSSAGSMLAINTLVSSLLGPLAGIVGATRQLQTVATHLDRIRDVLDERPEQPSRPGVTAGSARVSGEVSLQRAGFRYSGNGPWALRNVTLTIRPGTKVALVGRTGSGKSSLARMLLGLYEPAEGQVFFDGLPLWSVNYRELRARCGVVTQDPSLFGGTIRENIAFGRRGIGLAQIEESARRAQLHDEITDMPMGYETVLDEGGGGLSGGQRQRLALARALVHEPSLLVLDEATSHLDVVTERRVDEVLSALPCTRIVIAHRLSTIVNADVIVVLERGRIVEQGAHEELLASGTHYAALFRGQVRQDIGTRD